MRLNVVCHGNSLTWGYQLTPGVHQSTQNYPAVLATLRSLDTVYNKGTTGLTTVDLLNEFDSVVHPLFDASKVNVVYMWEACNDMASDGHAPGNASLAWQHYSAYCAHARLRGWQVVVSGMIPQNVSGEPSDTYRAAFNALLSDDHSFADGWIALESDSYYSDPNGSAFMPDHVHLADASYARIATVHLAPYLLSAYGFLMSGTVNKRLSGPSLLTNAAVTQYTAPGSGGSAQIKRIHVSNPSGSAVNFTLSIGASAAGTRLYDAYPIPAGSVLDIYGPFNLAASEIVQALGSTTNVLVLEIDGTETT